MWCYISTKSVVFGTIFFVNFCAKFYSFSTSASTLCSWKASYSNANALQEQEGYLTKPKTSQLQVLVKLYSHRSQDASFVSSLPLQNSQECMMTSSLWQQQFSFTSQNIWLKTDVSVTIQLPSSVHKTVKTQGQLKYKNIAQKRWWENSRNGNIQIQCNCTGVTMCSSKGGHKWEGGSPCLS